MLSKLLWPNPAPSAPREPHSDHLVSRHFVLLERQINIRKYIVLCCSLSCLQLYLSLVLVLGLLSWPKVHLRLHFMTMSYIFTDHSKTGLKTDEI